MFIAYRNVQCYSYDVIDRVNGAPQFDDCLRRCFIVSKLVRRPHIILRVMEFLRSCRADTFRKQPVNVGIGIPTGLLFLFILTSFRLSIQQFSRPGRIRQNCAFSTHFYSNLVYFMVHHLDMDMFHRIAVYLCHCHSYYVYRIAGSENRIISALTLFVCTAAVSLNRRPDLLPRRQRTCYCASQLSWMHAKSGGMFKFYF